MEYYRLLWYILAWLSHLDPAWGVAKKAEEISFNKTESGSLELKILAHIKGLYILRRVWVIQYTVFCRKHKEIHVIFIMKSHVSRQSWHALCLNRFGDSLYLGSQVLSLKSLRLTALCCSTRGLGSEATSSFELDLVVAVLAVLINYSCCHAFYWWLLLFRLLPCPRLPSTSSKRPIRPSGFRPLGDVLCS